MPTTVNHLLIKYVQKICGIYGTKLDEVILYGSYARGDFTDSSDIDIMILLNLDEMEIKKYRHQLSECTFDFNLDYNLDIKPLAKSRELFERWENTYPFYHNVKQEGVSLYHAAWY